LISGGVPHIFGNFSTRATTSLYTSTQSKFYTRSYEPPKSQKSQFQEFQDFQFGNPGTKWHLSASHVARHIEYYKEEGGGFP
jgi:hypothetical protein